MATQCAALSNPTDDKPQNPASEIVQPTVEDQNDTEAGASEGISSTSMFVNSEPMREEEDQNADPPQKVSNAQPSGTNQDGLVTSSSNVQPQVSTQIMQPSSAAPAGVSSTLTRSRFRWFYALLAAVGILALCGLAKAIVPWLKSWNRKVVVGEEEGSAKKTNSKPSLEQEAAAEASKAAAAAAAAAAKAAEEASKAAAAAAKAATEVADMARGGQEMLLSKSEEKKYFKELVNLIGMQVNLIGMQVQEMKLMSNAIQKLEGAVDANGMSSWLNKREIQEEQEAY